MGVANEIKIEISILGKQINEGNFKNRFIQDESRSPGKLYKAVSENGLEGGLKVFEEMQNNPESKLNSFSLHYAGIMLLKEGKVKEALEVLKKNIEMFPDASKLYDYYAEALAVAGKLAEAKIYYQKSLNLNVNNQKASEILRHLK